MKNLAFYIILILPLFFISCEEEIDWDTEKLPEMLVVEGGITNEYMIHNVKLTTTADYFYNKHTPCVSNARVSITDGANVFEMKETPAGLGIYETIDSVAGEAGKTYTLDIYLESPINNQDHYFATEKMVKGVDIDSMDAWIYENPIYLPNTGLDSLILVLVAYGQEPRETENFYQVNLYKNNVLLNDTIDEVSMFHDVEGYEGQPVSTFFFFEQYEEHALVKLEIISISEAYRQFVTGVQNIANQSFDPFNMSGPPANAIGNIQGAEAVGFFKVGYVSSSEAFAEIPVPEE